MPPPVERWLLRWARNRLYSEFGELAVEAGELLGVDVEVVLLDDLAPAGAENQDGAVLVDARAVRGVGMIVETATPAAGGPRRCCRRGL